MELQLHTSKFTIPVYHHSFSTSCSFQQSMYSQAEKIGKRTSILQLTLKVYAFYPRATCRISYRSCGTLISWPATRKYYWSSCVVKSFGDHWVTCVHLVRVTIATIQLKVVNSPKKFLTLYSSLLLLIASSLNCCHFLLRFYCFCPIGWECKPRFQKALTYMWPGSAIFTKMIKQLF